MEMIKLKALLQEQIAAPNKRDSKIFQAQFNKSSTLGIYEKEYPAEYKIAEKLKDAKGYVFSNSKTVFQTILSIKNIKQFNIVDKILKKMTGKGILVWIAGDNAIFNVQDKVSYEQLQLVYKHLTSINVTAGIKLLQNKLAYQWQFLRPLTPHEEMESAALLVSFIPVGGLFVSSGIMLIDAATYAKEGNYYEAGNSAIWAALPFIGPIGKLISKIPGVKPGITLTAKFFASIGKKIASKAWKALNPLELKIIRKLIEHKNLVKAELKKYLQRLAKTAPSKLKNVGRKGQAVIRQIANGTVDLAKLGGMLVGTAAKGLAPVTATQYMWNDLYYRLGLNKGAQERKVDYSISSDPDIYPTPGSYPRN